MLAMENRKKNRHIYECKICDYNTCNKFDFEKHTKTKKHNDSVEAIKNGDLSINLSQKSPHDLTYTCQNCKKEYKDYSGLWRHKKNCTKNLTVLDNNSNIEEINALKEIMKYLMKENSEMKNIMIEQQNAVLQIAKNGTHNNNNCNNTTTNSHNKAFNLNFFLNETCKDAMNIGEFVDSLKLQLPDLERVGELGYIEGISNIIVKNLKALDITKRPVHCTDKKRETCYIKDNNIWEKDENKTQMHKLIKKVVYKNVNMFAKYREEHPDCTAYHSKYNDQYQKIVYESMGGKGDDDLEKNERIIKNILKEVVVDKNL